MRLIKKLFFLYAIILPIMFFAGGYPLGIAITILFVLFLPVIIIGNNSYYYSVRITIWFAFLTQIITMPVFYLTPDDYDFFQDHRSFNYTGFETLSVYSLLVVFLLSFILICRLLLPISKYFQASDVNNNTKPYVHINKFEKIIINHNLYHYRYNHTIIFVVILLMFPLNDWMYSNGIGLTGVSPPIFPYKISGILTHLAKSFIPLFLCFLYILRDKTSVSVICILGVYSIYIGAATISRFPPLLIMTAPLVLACKHKRLFPLIVSFCFIIVSLGIATFSREIVYFVSDGQVYGDTTINLSSLIATTIERISAHQYILNLTEMVGRFEGFRALWFASQVNSSALGGPIMIWLKLIDQSFVDFGHHAIHMEVIGYVPPDGFYNVSGTFFDMTLWAINSNFLYIPLFALTLSIYLIIQEHSIIVIEKKYYINRMLARTVLTILTISEIVSPGSNVQNAIVITIFLIAIIPKIKVIASLLKCIRFVNIEKRPAA